MKATETNLLKFLNGLKQFIIPIYQRTYSWTPKQCRQLWDDVVRVATDPTRTGHFVGAIVYIQQGIYSTSQVPQLLVIDGQQRLTTLTLLLTALRGALPAGDGADMTPRKLTNYYLVNSDEDGDRRPKLVLTQSDRDTLLRLVGGTPMPAAVSKRVLDNYRLFEDLIKNSAVPPETIYQGIAKLIMVDIALDREQDNPQLIFESLNSTGLALSQADLIRNFLLMGLEPAKQDALYSDYWHPMEQSFAKAEDGSMFDRFMRDYLTVKTGSVPNIRDVYEAFKGFAERPETGDVHALVADVAAYAGYFTRMTLGTEPDTELARRFADINALKVDVAYPLLLELYHDYSQQILSRDDIAHMLDLLESYVFRRVICAIPTNSLNKTFGGFSRQVDKSNYVESFTARLLLLDSYRRFPRDDEFMRDLVTRDVYNLTTRRHYLLRKLENHGRKEPVPVEQYTIEHILPQNEDLGAEWRVVLGPQWSEVQARYLHTLGNLTLTGYNSELSDRPFLTKRDMEGGFAHSPLKLNRGLGQLTQWTPAEIETRAQSLATLATMVWPAAKLSDELLKKYTPSKQEGVPGGYSLEKHKHLTGPVWDLFDEFRTRVLELGPDVTMHVLKLYVAFKTDTNFVDVIPQATRLRLALNMEFGEVNDPRGMCEDATGRGLWGNGDVVITLERAEQLDAVMELVEQSYRRHSELAAV